MRRKTAGKKELTVAILTVMLCVTVFAILFVKSENSFFKLPEAYTSGEDFVKFIDVGQGDCILIHSNGLSALIDTGTDESAADINKVLYNCGIKKIDVLLLSHLHIDHTGGVAGIFEEFKVENLILPELSTYSEGIHSAQLAINEITKAGGGVYSAVQGMNFMLGDFEITILASYGKMLDENDRSLVIMAKIDKKKFLFMGDAERKTERKLIEENINLDCDVLKVGHHGSNTSSGKNFLKAVMPKYAVISVGKGNSYGHPHSEPLSGLKNIGAEILRTDKCGDITFYVQNGRIRLETEKG